MVDTINGDNLTHILYAFMRICGPNQSDYDADVCANKADHTLTEDATSIDKQFAKKFEQLQQRYPHLVILPSIGGWGGSDGFADMTTNEVNRAVFVADVVRYLRENPGFAGLDIDWEWPSNLTEGQGYVALMQDLRAAFDELSIETGRQYQVTSSIGASGHAIAQVDYSTAQNYMDYIFLMTYDYFGGWTNNNIGHHTGLYPHSNNQAPGWGTGSDESMQNLLNAGVSPDKMVMGVAAYGRGWRGVTPAANGSPIGGDAQGVYPIPQASWENGENIYRDIRAKYLNDQGNGMNGWQNIFDDECQCYYLWHAEDGNFIGFDDPRSIKIKGDYVLANQFAGVFTWEYSHDNGEIIAAMNHAMGNQLSESAK